MSTKTWTYAPIIGALVKAEEMLGPDRYWQGNANCPDYERQEKFLNNHFNISRDALADLKELASIADVDPSVVNEFLQKRGFDAQLDSQKRGNFFVASVLDLMVKWTKPGTTTTLTAKNGQSHDAIKLKSPGQIKYCSSKIFLENQFVFIIEITAQSGDIIYLIYSDDFEQNWEINELGEFLSEKPMSNQHPKGVAAYFDELIFPMINLDQQPDISWLSQIHTVDNGGYFISIAQALQQTKLKMNEVGARVQSASQLRLMTTCIVHDPTRLIIDSPFFMVIERPGLPQPLFVGYLDYDCWKNPGNLD